MDTSKHYFNMCRAAAEIQEKWKPAGGDFYLHDYRGSTGTDPDFEKKVWGDKDETWNRVEILSYQPTDEKSFWVSTDGKRSVVVSCKDLVKEHSIWLPRQDQLQEMVAKNALYPNADYHSSTFRFVMWAYELNHGGNLYAIVNDYASMEQLWLVFVMKEKYDKTWNRIGWVLI